MMRRLIALAMSSGIPMSEWEAYGERAIETGWELLEDAADEAKRR